MPLGNGSNRYKVMPKCWGGKGRGFSYITPKWQLWISGWSEFWSTLISLPKWLLCNQTTDAVSCEWSCMNLRVSWGIVYTTRNVKKKRKEKALRDFCLLNIQQWRVRSILIPLVKTEYKVYCWYSLRLRRCFFVSVVYTFKMAKITFSIIFCPHILYGTMKSLRSWLLWRSPTNNHLLNVLWF